MSHFSPFLYLNCLVLLDKADWQLYKLMFSKLNHVWLISVFTGSWSSLLSILRLHCLKCATQHSLSSFSAMILCLSRVPGNSVFSIPVLPSLHLHQLFSHSVKDEVVLPLDHSLPLIWVLSIPSSNSACTWLFQSSYFSTELLFHSFPWANYHFQVFPMQKQWEYLFNFTYLSSTFCTSHSILSILSQ